VIYIKDGFLKKDLFVKPTNKQIFLDYNSNHPTHCKDSLPYSQALRVVERCSDIENKDTHLQSLKSKLEERNYPPKLIEKQFQRANQKTRKSLISQKRPDKKVKDDKIRIIFTHNQANPPVHRWLREAKRLLVRNDKAKAIGDRLQIGYKQP
jgi:hypothetical protein